MGGGGRAATAPLVQFREIRTPGAIPGNSKWSKQLTLESIGPYGRQYRRGKGWSCGCPDRFLVDIQPRIPSWLTVVCVSCHDVWVRGASLIRNSNPP